MKVAIGIISKTENFNKIEKEGAKSGESASEKTKSNFIVLVPS